MEKRTQLNNFETVNELFLTTKIRSESCNKLALPNGKIKLKATSDKNTVPIMNVMNCAQFIAMKVLTKGRNIRNRVIGQFAWTRKDLAILIKLTRFVALSVFVAFVALFSRVKKLLKCYVTFLVTAVQTSINKFDFYKSTYCGTNGKLTYYFFVYVIILGSAFS